MLPFTLSGSFRATPRAIAKILRWHGATVKHTEDYKFLFFMKRCAWFYHTPRRANRPPFSTTYAVDIRFICS
jgi:hypothetical protein